ncbi:MAG: ComF family protein [Verrucomicrobia bacterium]|nr:ComF family protein [Verrucomicrobiota bacterium]
MAFDFKTLVHPFLDVVFPRNCVITGEPVDELSPYQFISEAAASKIFQVNPPHCQTCGYPYFGAVMASDRACPKCKELKPVYRQGKTVILVEGVGRELVHKFKYEGAEYLLQDFYTLFANSPGLIDYVDGAQLVPVPLHPRKYRERGFNQSEALCRALIRLQPSARMANILVRTIDTPSQTLFSRKERMRNLRSVFKINPTSEIKADDRHILVDDVFTTGSTLNACARAMKKDGIHRIDILTLGHG